MFFFRLKLLAFPKVMCNKLDIIFYFFYKLNQKTNESVVSWSSKYNLHNKNKLKGFKQNSNTYNVMNVCSLNILANVTYTKK